MQMYFGNFRQISIETQVDVVNDLLEKGWVMIDAFNDGSQVVFTMGATFPKVKPKPVDTRVTEKKQVTNYNETVARIAASINSRRESSEVSTPTNDQSKPNQGGQA